MKYILVADRDKVVIAVSDVKYSNFEGVKLSDDAGNFLGYDKSSGDTSSWYTVEDGTPVKVGYVYSNGTFTPPIYKEPNTFALVLDTSGSVCAVSDFKYAHYEGKPIYENDIIIGYDKTDTASTSWVDIPDGAKVKVGDTYENGMFYTPDTVQIPIPLEELKLLYINQKRSYINAIELHDYVILGLPVPSDIKEYYIRQKADIAAIEACTSQEELNEVLKTFT